MWSIPHAISFLYAAISVLAHVMNWFAGLLEECEKLQHPLLMSKMRTLCKLSKKQVQVLENAYRTNLYPDYSLKMNLSEELNLEWGKVNKWFIDRRFREKKRSGKR